ncbi:hypothetical protein [Salisediminibacterium halotolerans]|uniref:hypothetical protein n=1 Tax=Salisediminibacterium halotolerans TaxID=517425 RepID=UPI00115FEBC5|nr:hypothetical protein [Salisediminibacterium haloalkalitolerans]
MTTHRPASFRGRAPSRFGLDLQGLVCLAIPQEKAGMLGHPLSLNRGIHNKESHASTPPTPPGKQETKIRIRRSDTAES